MAAIDELGYQPSSSAQSLRSQRAGALGVEVNTLGRGSHNETMAPFLASLGMRAGLHGTHVVPFGSPENSPMLDGYRQMWARRLVDAFVIADTHHGDPRPPWLEGNGIPFASFGRVWDDPTVHLVGRRRRRLRHPGRGRALRRRRLRHRGLPRAGRTARSSVTTGDTAGSSAAPPPAPTHTGPRRPPPCRTSTPPGTPRGLLLREIGPGDAVVCASDILALGVHHELLTAGLRPGLDVGVVGFDGSETALMHHLTSVAQPLDAIAEQVLVLLDDAMAGRTRPAAGVLLEPTLTQGRSTDRTAPSA